MKIKLAGGLVAGLVILAVVVGIVAADYATSYQSYVNAGGSYQNAYNTYLTARASYFASGSLDSQDKAKSATLAMLQARDGLVIAYLNAISAKIAGVAGMSDADKSSLSGLINNEVAWYQPHSVKLTSAGSSGDLIGDSDEAKGQYGNSTLLVVYLSLIDLGAANNNAIRSELNNEISTLSAKISEIKVNQDKDISFIERSLVDVQNKISRSQDKDNAAKDLISSLKPTDQQANGAFGDAQTDLTGSNSYLKEANQELLQIISQIKTN